jgi:murein DD-endopeptidase MepM/ murein hydrolase activator NlpD
LRPPAPPKAPEQASQSGESASTFAGAPTTYIVAPGENVFSIARKLNVPIRSLLEVNRLGPPFKLSTGQRLIVPVPGRHIVTRGETVYSISRRYHVDMASLMQTNRIEEPYRIAVGQVLTLPGSNNPFAAATSRARDAAVLSAKTPAAPQSTTDAPVTSETQSSAANQSKTQAVRLPRPKPRGSPAPARTDEPAPRAAPVDRVTAQSAQAAVPKPVRRPPLGAPNPPPRSSGKFLWPLEGKILSSYGSKGSGVHNDGINIESPSGTIVRAAENGVVAYSGNELRGFGRLLLIRHSGGWVTAYAHLGQVMVSRGDTVERGQAIAKVGRTGNVSRPQLHFEIRKGTRAVDPRKLLGSKEAKL